MEYNLQEMTPETTPEYDAQPEQMSEISRLSGVFFEPSKAFSDIGERPRWLVPMLIAIVTSLVFCATVSSRVGWDRVTRQALDQREARMTPEQRQQLEKSFDMTVKITSVSAYVGSVLATPLIGLICGGILLGIVNGFMSGGLRFKQMFAIICYSGLPRVLYALLAIAVMYMKKPEDFNIQNPVGFNPGAYMDPNTTSKFIHSLATSLDLFTIWVLILIAVGIREASGKKLTLGGSLAAVAVPWALYALCAGGLAAAFS